MTRILLLAAISTLVASAAAGAGGLGSLSVKGMIRAEVGVATHSGGNPQNAHRYEDAGRDLQMSAVRTELDFTWRRDDHLSGFMKLRAWGDAVNKIDHDLNDSIDLFGGDEYPGNGWLLATTGGSNVLADVAQAYVDIRDGPWWLRIGKQQIAWGESIFFRSLDMVNSLDLRRHHVFDVLSEEYADERIGQLGVRGSLRIPGTDFELEAFVTDFTPTLLAPPGSPYSSLPTQFSLEDAGEIADARHKPVYGGRIRGDLEGLQVQLNFVSRPQQVGVFRFKRGTVPGTPFNVDEGRGFRSSGELVEALDFNRFDTQAVVNTLVREWGVPSALFTTPGALDALLAATPLTGAVTREFPRVNIVGGGVNYMFQFGPGHPLRFMDSVIARMEATLSIDKDFTTPGGSRDFIERDELNFAFVLEKWHKFHHDIPATFIVFEWWRKNRSDFLERLKSSEDEHNFDVLAVAIQQQLSQNRIRLDLVTAYDVDQGLWVQPGVRWKPRDDFQVDVYYNHFWGDQNDLFGTFDALDEAFVRLSYYF